MHKLIYGMNMRLTECILFLGRWRRYLVSHLKTQEQLVETISFLSLFSNLPKSKLDILRQLSMTDIAEVLADNIFNVIYTFCKNNNDRDINIKVIEMLGYSLDVNFESKEHYLDDLATSYETH